MAEREDEKRDEQREALRVAGRREEASLKQGGPARDGVLEERLQHRLGQEAAQLATVEDLTEGLVVVRARTWLAIYSLLALLLVLFLWSLFGSIPIQVEGQGIFINQKGLFNVQAKTAGVVRFAPRMKSGGIVREGEYLGETFDPEAELKLTASEGQFTQLEGDLKRLQREIDVEHAAEVEALKRDLAAHDYAIQETLAEIPQLEKSLAEKTKLLNEGLLPEASVHQAQEQLAAKRITLESTRAEIASLKSRLAKGYRTEEFKAKEQQLLQIKKERDILRLAKEYSKIYSPDEGTVIDVLASEGDRVVAGAPLIWLEHTKAASDDEVVYGFIPVERSRRVKVGTQVQIEVATVSKEQYGRMLGTVKEISRFPLSTESISKMVPSKGLIQFLMGNAPAATYLLIEPETDASTVSGYKWTTAQGPPFKIATGTVCHIKAITERIRPFYYVFPSYRLREEEHVQTQVVPNE